MYKRQDERRPGEEDDGDRTEVVIEGFAVELAVRGAGHFAAPDLNDRRIEPPGDQGPDDDEDDKAGDSKGIGEPTQRLPVALAVAAADE